MRLINARRMALSPVITPALPMAEAHAAFKLASDRDRVMSALIDFARPA
jgi:hypothetical protein